MISRLCDRLAVMYRGRIVEEAPIAALADPEAPNHPYTRELKIRAEELSRGREGSIRRGSERSPDAVDSQLSGGCPYRSRCLVIADKLVDPRLCQRERPHLEWIEEGQRVACHASERDLVGLGSRRLVAPSLEERDDDV
jgi:ABC-type dipeptide/oligopeptide/nickel transport system ATPase component